MVSNMDILNPTVLTATIAIALIALVIVVLRANRRPEPVEADADAPDNKLPESAEATPAP